MSLVPDYGNSSESSSSDSDGSCSSPTNSISETNIQQLCPNTSKLPKPAFLCGKGDTNLPRTSVFHNPYIEAENEKKAILEKHVKMVNTKDNVQQINGKKICWNYRKGKCRFGHNCMYAHDSDLQKSNEQLETENQLQQTLLCQNQLLPQPTTDELNQIKEEATLSNTKRKRPGLTQGLVPGKKVMKNYIKYKK